MEFKTKFDIGETVWTIRKFKVVQIEIYAIEIRNDGVWLREKNDYTLINENHCFAKREQLFDYLLDNGDENL